MNNNELNSAYLVTEYENTQVYGGPEEGGWYHTFRRTVRVHFCGTKKDCLNLAKTLNEQTERQDGNYEELGGDETVSGMYPEGYIPTGWAASSSSTFLVEPSDKPGYHDNTSNGLPTYE